MTRTLPALALIARLAVPLGAAEAGRVTATSGPFSYNVGVTSLAEARFREVIKQHYDFSCGSAAIATLLTYHYGRPTPEQAVFRGMWSEGDREAIETYGFSLLDMKLFLDSLGYVADGFEAPLDKLQEVGIPAVALINLEGYMHFVVIKGVSDHEVLVGDPALGVRIYSRPEFEAMWNGILFVITSHLEDGQEVFNASADWAVRRKAPLGTALSRQNLAATRLMLPGPNQF